MRFYDTRTNADPSTRPAELVEQRHAAIPRRRDRVPLAIFRDALDPLRFRQHFRFADLFEPTVEHFRHAFRLLHVRGRDEIPSAKRAVRVHAVENGQAPRTLDTGIDRSVVVVSF